MQFIARYVHKEKQQPDYYRDVHGNNLTEASHISEIYLKNGYIVVSLIHKVEK